MAPSDKPQTHKLQEDQPEGAREVIERELKRQGGDKNKGESGSPGSAGKTGNPS